MERAPDIVVVLSDQQRPDSCGIYGQQLPVTPVLDELARDGVVFDRAFTVQPVCGPARSSIQTGLTPTTTGCWRNGLALPQGIDTLATRLGAIGYRTGYVGKWHLASDWGLGRPPGRSKAQFGTKPIPPERRGGYRDGWFAADALEHTSGPYGGRVFDADGNPVALDGYRVDALGDIAIAQLKEFMDSSDDDRPFLLFVSFLEPHHQNNRLRSIGPRGWAQRFRDYDVPGDLVGTLGDWRWNYAEYLACCASIDTNLGRLTDALQAAGRLDSTLLMYSSDHGSHFRTRNLEYKRSSHDASIRIPLIVRGPGFRAGVRSDALVTHLDILPTLVTAAGGDDPALDGRPLQAALTADGSRDMVFFQISEAQIGRGLRTPTHTYAVKAPGLNPLRGHLYPDADRYIEDKLYDLADDPHQRHNLIREPGTSGLRQRLATRLVDEIEHHEGKRPKISMRS